MFKVMGMFDIGMTKLYVGEQNFNNNTVSVRIGTSTINCPMFMDEDNDIYFVYAGEKIYFRWLK